MVVTRRITNTLNKLFPSALVNAAIANQLNRRLDHDMYGLRPDYPPLAQHPMVNDDLGNRIACGSIKIKTDVKQFMAAGVEFVDGSFEDDIDVVSFSSFISVIYYTKLLYFECARPCHSHTEMRI